MVLVLRVGMRSKGVLSGLEDYPRHVDTQAVALMINALSCLALGPALLRFAKCGRFVRVSRLLSTLPGAWPTSDCAMDEESPQIGGEISIKIGQVLYLKSKICPKVSSFLLTRVG